MQEPAVPPRPAPQSTPATAGSFLLAFGPGARACVSSARGHEVSVEGDLAIAAQGAVQQGRTPDGTRWIALADLIEGELAAGAGALDAQVPPQRHWRGRFAQVLWRPGERRIAACTDHFSTLSLYVCQRGDTLLLATDLRLIAASGLCARRTDPTAIYHYLNFSCIPAPYTIYDDVRRLSPGTRLRWDAALQARQDRYFIAEYPEDLDGSDAELAATLRERMVASVEAWRPPGATDWGCFLSGGTDSSSIVSILARQQPDTQVRTFSIGYAEEGYDELGFARTVAEACRTEAYSARVDSGQAVALVGKVVDAYDQPFGNSSAIPSMACAELAAEHGIRVLVAGDGGDEIFGGNERYAKDRVMEAFYRLPRPLRGLGRALGGLAGRSPLHLLQRMHNFTERASLPNPDRFYSDHGFGSEYYARLLQPELRARVERDASLAFMREVYALGSPASTLHRIMRLDLYMAIAQNDLVKVEGACRAQAITTRFPYLDPDLVDFTGRLATRCKVRGLNKRHLFKLATASLLPQEILNKKKHGFGLPIAVWLRRDADFQQMVRDILFDARSAERGVFQTAFLETLLAEHMRGSWDHAEEIWQLLVLELWLRKHEDRA